MGFLNYLQKIILGYAIKKEIDNDPEFKQTITDYSEEIDRLAKEIDRIDKKHGWDKYRKLSDT